jgi:hypothetical protein
MKKQNLIIAIIAVLGAAVGVYFAFFRKSKEEEDAENEAAQALAKTPISPNSEGMVNQAPAIRGVGPGQAGQAKIDLLKQQVGQGGKLKMQRILNSKSETGGTVGIIPTATTDQEIYNSPFRNQTGNVLSTEQIRRAPNALPQTRNYTTIQPELKLIQ